MKILVRIAVVAIVVMVAALMYWSKKRQEQSSDDLTLYGNVDIREVDMAFRQPGRLATMELDEGSRVSRGDLLARLDDTPFREALAASEAQVQRAEAELSKYKSGNRPQEIKRAEFAVAQARAAVIKAEANLARQTELTETGAASERTLEAARAEHDNGAAQLASAQETLSLFKEGARSEDIAVARARLAAAVAARTQAQTALADTRLSAPSDGIVMARIREPGSMVTSRDPVYTLSLTEPVYVRAYVSEPDLGRVSPGTAVLIQTDASDRSYQGKVGYISPRAEFTPKSVETQDLRTDLVYRLRIVVGQGEDLRQGMPVTIALQSGGDQGPEQP